MNARRLTMAQALIGFLRNQYVERDGRENRFFAGAWGNGFGVFCEYFIYGLFVVGLALTLFGNLLRIMRKVRD